MSDRSQLISRLLRERDFRAAYIRAKLDVLIPSQLRALRLSQDKTQPEVARLSDMKQSRISAIETPGRVNFNLETLVRLAATHSIGLIVKFVPFSEMLEWENEYSQDTFNVTQLSEDIAFLHPKAARTVVGSRSRRRRKFARSSSWLPQSSASNNTYALSIQQRLNTQTVFQMNLQFEPKQHPSSRGLVEIAKRIPPTGSVNFGFPNTATGAQSYVANAPAA